MQVSIKWAGLGGMLIFLVIIALLTKNAYLKFVDNYEIGYRFNTLNGTTTVLNRTGWFGKKPFVETINTVDLRPFQTCINANQRVLNCKLVRFNPEGLALFISWHGRKDYTLSFSSTSSSSGQASGNFEDIMRSYAYDGSGRSYPFLTILRELKNDEPPTPAVAVAVPAIRVAPQPPVAGAGQ